MKYYIGVDLGMKRGLECFQPCYIRIENYVFDLALLIGIVELCDKVGVGRAEQEYELVRIEAEADFIYIWQLLRERGDARAGRLVDKAEDVIDIFGLIAAAAAAGVEAGYWLRADRAGEKAERRTGLAAVAGVVVAAHVIQRVAVDDTEYDSGFDCR